MGSDKTGLAAAAASWSGMVRGLTEGEIALCRSIFPEDLPYEGVRLIDGPLANDAAEIASKKGNTAITLRRTIYFFKHFCPDFSTAGDRARRLFVHEMTHVWQWRTLGVARFGLRYARELVAVRGVQSALYDYWSNDWHYDRSRLEAQAEMVGDYQVPDKNRALIEKKLSGTRIYGL